MLPSDTPAAPSRESATPADRSPGRTGAPLPAQSRGSRPGTASTPSGLARLNAADPDAAEAALLTCCGSDRWARRLASHRPYPDLGALLAAADEASYDLTPADLAEALTRETAPGPRHEECHTLPDRTGSAALTALRAAHAAYESRFGHAFVICLDGLRPDELLDHVLAGLRARLGHEVEEERGVTAEELRRIASGRLTRLATEYPDSIASDHSCTVSGLFAGGRAAAAR